ncbi:MAG TPA: DUF167 domain-containing protein [Burkholderiales bacterium]|nr:DUF167 domain-containing protein [Burkholderiales bacterium]
MAAILSVKVQPRSKAPGVERLPDGSFRVRVQAAPDRGRANQEVLDRLAGFLGVPPSRLTIVRGEGSSHKWIRFGP